MLFGSNRDFELLVKVNRELLKDIVEQEILFYKLNLEETDANIYGEALTKSYFVPAKLNCLITRGDQVVSIDDFTLPDLQREASFAFLRPDLEDISLSEEQIYKKNKEKIEKKKKERKEKLEDEF